MPSFPTGLPHLPPAGQLPAPDHVPVQRNLLPGGTLKAAPARASVTPLVATTRHSSAKAVLRMGNLPNELIAHIGGQLDRPDLLALGQTSTVQRNALDAQLRAARADIAIERIASQGSYADAREAVRGLLAPLRAERIGALARKSQHSGQTPVAAFAQLAADLEALPPAHRGAAFATLTAMLRLMCVRETPLLRDQERGHATLLQLALAMPAALQREALGNLTQAWLPPDGLERARAALAALGPA